MRVKEKPGGANTGRGGGPCGPGDLQTHYTPAGPECQTLASHPADLAKQAAVKAEDCRRAGDLQGWEHWRRQMLHCQAQAWQETHPDPQPQEVRP